MNTPSPRYEIYSRRNWRGGRRWRWRFRASNGQVVARGEAYVRSTDCEHAIELLQSAARAPVWWVRK